MLEPLEPQRALEVLRNGTVGHLGLVSEGRPYVVPITYAFDAHAIIGHSAPGHKLDALRNAQSVCFQVEEIDDLHHWRSVIAWGRFEEMHGPARARALELLVAAISPQLDASAPDPHAPSASGPHGEPPTDAEAAAERAGIAVFRIHLDEIHGRYETPGSRNYKLRVADTVFEMTPSQATAG